MNSIVALTGLELETVDLAKTIVFYSTIFGLEVSRQEVARVEFKGTGRQSPQLTFNAGTRHRLIALEFEMHPSGDLAAFAAELGGRGVNTRRVSDTRLLFTDPDGTQIALSRSPGWQAEDVSSAADRPIHVSHVVVNSPDPGRLIRFYVDTLGFCISDKYERGLLTLLRCDQPQHHCVGVSPAKYSGLNHFAMECGTIDAVMTGVGRMKRAGLEPIWGPGRHGPGGNVFCYFEDPNSFVVEYTCEVLAIPKGVQWQPREWARTAENANVWGTGGASPRAIQLMSDNP